MSHYYLLTMGTWGEFTCNIIERVTSILPSSPVTLSQLADESAAHVPFLGTILIYRIFRDFYSVLNLVVFWKILKVLPGKF